MADKPEMHWLDETEVVSAEEMCRACRITMEELREVAAYGAPVATAGPEGEWAFGGDWVVPLRTAARMARDFDLDLFAVSILARNLHRIDMLEREVRELRARLPS